MWDMAYIRGLRGGGRKKTHAKRRVCGRIAQLQTNVMSVETALF